MKDEELTKIAREKLEEYPMGARLSLFWAVGKTLTDDARQKGIPSEEVITQEVIEEEALMVVKRMIGAFLGRFAEFVTREAWERILYEEFERLAQEQPDGRVTEDALKEAVMVRVQRDYPHVFKMPRRRRKSSS
jgi:hypothetical protein